MRQEAKRRVVLLGPDDHGLPVVVLSTPTADNLHAEIVRQAAAHSGRRVAGEYHDRGEWVRWVWAGERSQS